MDTLTDRQAEILELIRAFWSGQGYPPTVRELQELTGIKSPNGMQNHLIALRRKGWITWEDGKSRTIRLLGVSDAES